MLCGIQVMKEIICIVGFLSWGLITPASGEESHVSSLCGVSQPPLAEDEIPQTPPNLVGSWTSTRCETRSGSHFVLRHHSFTSGSLENEPHTASSIGQENNESSIDSSKNLALQTIQPIAESHQFTERTKQTSPITETAQDFNETIRREEGSFALRVHEYSDDECGAPFLTYVARGSYDNMKKSWTVPGAYDMEYTLNRVVVVPHTQSAASFVAARVARACPERNVKGWKPGRSYKVFWYPSEKSSVSRSSASNRPRREFPGLLPLRKQHHVVYFHDEVTNSTRTVPLQLISTEGPSPSEIPSYFEAVDLRSNETHSVTSSEPNPSPNNLLLLNRAFQQVEKEANYGPQNDDHVVATLHPHKSNASRDQNVVDKLHFDCMQFLDISWDELQLVRITELAANPKLIQQIDEHKEYEHLNDNRSPDNIVVQNSETRTTSSGGNDRIRADQENSVDDATKLTKKLLYLGQVHWEHDSTEGKLHHRPTTYQTPLQFHRSKNSLCPVCRYVLEGSEMRPPRLPALTTRHLTATPQRLLSGRWVSSVCETSLRHGLFTRRDFTFMDDGRWSLEQHHFTDPHCHSESFRLTAKGLFKLFTNNRRKSVMSTHNAHLNNPEHASPRPAKRYPIVMLLMTELSIRPMDESTTKQLNSNSLHDLGECGKISSWRRGLAHDVTNAGGCKALGVTVPALYKIEIKFEVTEDGHREILLSHALEINKELLHEIHIGAWDTVPNKVGSDASAYNNIRNWGKPVSSHNTTDYRMRFVNLELNSTKTATENVMKQNDSKDFRPGDTKYHSYHIHRIDLVSKLFETPGDSLRFTNNLFSMELDRLPWSEPLVHCPLSTLTNHRYTDSASAACPLLASFWIVVGFVLSLAISCVS